MISWINEIQRANYQVSVVMYCVKTIKKDTIQNTGTYRYWFHYFTGYRLHNFFVGVSDIVPRFAFTPSPGIYSICANYSGVAEDGENLTLSCQPETPPGQIIIVQMLFAREYLQLCEVAVYVNTTVPGIDTCNCSIIIILDLLMSELILYKDSSRELILSGPPDMAEIYFKLLKMKL